MKHTFQVNTDPEYNVRKFYEYEEESDIRVLKKIFVCGKYFGITPFSLTGKRYTVKLITFAVLLAWVCYAYFVTANKNLNTDKVTVSFMVTDYIFDISEFSFIITCYINSNIFKVQRWKKLYRKLNQCEILLRKQNFQLTRKTIYCYCEILLIFFIFGSVNAYRIYTRIRHDEYIIIIITLFGVIAIDFYVTFFLILVCSIIRIVKRRFAFLSQIIEYINGEIFLDKGAIKKFEEVVMLYRILHLVVMSFNETFGWLIFLYIAKSVAYILSAVMFGMENDVGEERILSLSIMIFIYVVFLTGMIICCDLAEKSGKQVITKCHLLHQQAKSKLVKEHLLQLAYYAECWRPIFSAAGFYNVNQLTLITIFNATITYLVILIQFSLALKG